MFYRLFTIPNLAGIHLHHKKRCSKLAGKKPLPRLLTHLASLHVYVNS